MHRLEFISRNEELIRGKPRARAMLISCILKVVVAKGPVWWISDCFRVKNGVILFVMWYGVEGFWYCFGDFSITSKLWLYDKIK